MMLRPVNAGGNTAVDHLSVLARTPTQLIKKQHKGPARIAQLPCVVPCLIQVAQSKLL